MIKVIWGLLLKSGTLEIKNWVLPPKLLEVPTVDFRKCLEEFGIPYYLKIDIEGMDTFCLEQLLHFDEKPKYISIESEKVSFKKLLYEFELFERLGYNKYQVVNQAEVPKAKEPTDSKEGRYLDYEFKYGSSGLFGSDFKTPWISKRAALSRYKYIFYGYKLWGDTSKIRRWLIMRGLRVILSMLLGNYVPGWYDTHAKHASIKEN